MDSKYSAFSACVVPIGASRGTGKIMFCGILTLLCFVVNDMSQGNEDYKLFLL